MARTKQESPKRIAILSKAVELFFDVGFSQTSASLISSELGISKGNLTFHYPTKEHILDELVKMMCDFQWQAMKEATDEGKSYLLAYCLELTTMAAISEENEQMRDFYISAYSHPMTLDNIRLNDVKKLKQVFGEYCEDWTEQQYFEAECIVAGIEYATLMTTEHSTNLHSRIEGALNSIMLIFGVPEEMRNTKLSKVFAMDYRAIGRKMLEDFKAFTKEENNRAIDELLASYNLKRT